MRTLNAQPRRTVRRDGMALVLALGAIVVIGAVVAGGFYVATRDVRTGRMTTAQERAQLRAEHALNLAREQMESKKPQIATDGGMLVYVTAGNAIVTRLNRDAYQISVALNEKANGGADRSNRRVSMLVVRRVPEMTFPGALTVRGTTQIGGNTEIDGTDQNPSGWDCPPAGDSKPGIVTPSLGDLKTSGGGCNNFDCVSGEPHVLPSADAAKDETYFQYGNMTWAELVTYARKITPGTYTQIEPVLRADGSCNTTLDANWGDPIKGGASTACESYYPMIYVPGNLKLTGNYGQGVLLVEGDLTVEGAFKFYGPVIVRGHLATQGTGGHFNGGVMAANVDFETNQALGDATINYSSCAIATALTNSSPMLPVRQRSWAEMF